MENNEKLSFPLMTPQLTYLIFHKMADEYAKPYSRDIGIPKSFAWTSLMTMTRRGAELEAHYVTLLRRFGSP